MLERRRGEDEGEDEVQACVRQTCEQMRAATERTQEIMCNMRRAPVLIVTLLGRLLRRWGRMARWHDNVLEEDSICTDNGVTRINR